jgi:hypothetical protein
MVTPQEAWMMQARTWKEAQLEAEFHTLATALGWRWFHPPRAVKEKITAGYPDDTLVKPPRLLFAELKQEGKYPSVEQRAWHADLLACGVEVYVWRPYDFLSGRIRAVLMGVPFQEPLPVGGLTRRR